MLASHNSLIVTLVWISLSTSAIRAGIVSTLKTILSLGPVPATPWMSYKCSLNWTKPQNFGQKLYRHLSALQCVPPNVLPQPSPTFPTQQSQIMIKRKPHYHLHLQAKPLRAYAGCSGYLGCHSVLVVEILKQLLKIRGVTRRNVTRSMFLLG